MRRLALPSAVIVGLAAACLLSACGGGESAEVGEDVDTGVGACSPSQSAESGSEEQQHTLDGVEQPYWVAVPETYDASTPVSLYIVVPGGSGSAQSAAAGWGPTLDGVDALVVFADVGAADRKTVPMMRALIDDVADKYCVDRDRVFASGTSATAAFTGRLMANASDVIAAFAVGIGRFGTIGLEPDGPVPLIAWSGDPDRGVVEGSVAEWADSNGCEIQPTVSDLGSGVVHHHYEGCGAPVEYYFFAGMGHQVPNHDCSADRSGFGAEYEEFDFWDDAGSFFEAHPLTQS